MPTRHAFAISALLQTRDSSSVLSGYHVADTIFSLALSLIRSVFGEDALVNVSVEKKDDNDGKLSGYIRIRSKTQGIALSLGDRITTVQRGLPEKKD
jgi:hypothetical protein